MTTYQPFAVFRTKASELFNTFIANIPAELRNHDITPEARQQIWK